MSEPFKEQINRVVIETMTNALAAAGSAFQRDAFLSCALPGIESLELKARCLRLVEALEQALPEKFTDSAKIIRAALPKDPKEPRVPVLSGWCLWAVQEFVARAGLQEPEIALPLLRDMTTHFSSEFGIRPFIEAHPILVLKTFQFWARDPSEHVRRLVSEGSRTRLPWGMQLRRLKSDPSPMLPILELLKDDPSEYVRRSVANHLNDWSKDHPELTCTIAERWSVDANVQRKRLIAHALRTLVKAGNPRALAILGCSKPALRVSAFSVQPQALVVGESLTLTTSIQSDAMEEQTLIIDYIIHHRKANGLLSPKVFKGKKTTLAAQSGMEWKKQHPMRPVTTRTYYPGAHEVELIINGQSFGKCTFELSFPS